MICHNVMGRVSSLGVLLWVYRVSIASMREYLIRRRSMARARRLTRRLLSQNRPVQLELGSAIPRAGWITVHFRRDADLTLDLAKPLPFSDGSVDRIYSAHSLDHLQYEDAIRLLKESYRILKNGGTFSICVPDAAFYLDSYCSSQPFDVKRFCIYEFALHYHSRIDIVNYIAYMGGMHKYMYDRENLIAVLRSAGFEKVALRDFDSELDLLKPDDHRCIYAAAVKQPA
jgi:predicted SAM-dependent methyltransferase